MLLHMTGYIITNLAAFTAIIAYHNQTGAEELTDFRGMSDRSPLLAMITAAALFSLAGLPLFAGFFTKFVFFASVSEEGYLWLAGIAVLSSFISLYYYLIVLKAAYIDPTEQRARISIPMFTQAVAVVLTLGVFFVGLYPAPLFDVTDNVAKVLFPS
jgi:NADH-quinone oxidoreductase subunit N